MFKNKKSVYILLPLTLFIWGFLGYKIYIAFNEDEIPDFGNQNFTEIKTKPEDTVKYKLALNYPDPFLKSEPSHGLASNNMSSQNRNVKPILIPEKNANDKKPTEIKYLGIVQNNTSGVATALISINGKSYTVQKGEEIDGIIIKSIEKEKIEVKIGKEVSTFRR